MFLFRNLYVPFLTSLLLLSFGTLTFNRYPVVAATDAKTSRVLLIVVIVLHAGFAIAIKILFFAHGSPAVKGPLDSDDDDDKDGADDDAARMLFRFAKKMVKYRA